MRSPFVRNALALMLVFGFVTTTANSARADAWNEYPYPDDGYAISAPSAPLKMSTTENGTAANPLPTHSIIWRTTDGLVLLAASSVAKNGFNTVNGDPVDQVLSGEIESLQGGHLVSKKTIVLPGASGIECVLEGTAFNAQTRIMRQGNQIWALLALAMVSKPFSDQADRFFASFRLIPAAKPK